MFFVLFFLFYPLFVAPGSVFRLSPTLYHEDRERASYGLELTKIVKYLGRIGSVIYPSRKEI